MADTQETVADIIAEMRKTYVSKGGAGYCGEVWIDLLRYAVLLRTIDVLKGWQELGRPEAKGEQ